MIYICLCTWYHVDAPSVKVTPSYRYFGAKIKNHPENALEKEETHHVRKKPRVSQVYMRAYRDDPIPQDDFTEPTEVVFKEGRVAGLGVDAAFLDLVRNQRGPAQICQVML